MHTVWSKQSRLSTPLAIVERNMQKINNNNMTPANGRRYRLIGRVLGLIN